MTDVPPHERRKRGMAGVPAIDPWSAPVLLAQIPSTGLHKAIEANAAQTAALAAAGGLLGARDVRAEFTLTPLRGDQVKVEGRVTGRVDQICVVTLEPPGKQCRRNHRTAFRAGGSGERARRFDGRDR